ncbi:MAG: hypothetical protein PHH60_01210, partial [Candidatus Margulisbacteria bacterium]|nr:hypothetical protein [Candidatus Margulisiibacteriota bacterium]
LAAISGYGRIVKYKTDFGYDATGSDATANSTFDWTQVASYNFTYNTTGASTNYQGIDNISAGNVGGSGEVVVSEVVIDSITPPAGPAGTKFVATGEGFGATQGQSLFIFENNSTGINYEFAQEEILSWSNTTIEAIVPKLAPAGDYTLKVIKIAISAGMMQAFESNPKGFQVTAGISSGGLATIYPNPFNPLETSVPSTRASGMSGNAATIAFTAAGVSNIGIYIYDTNARLVFHEVTNTTQVTWNGRDTQGALVADGVYLLRIVNEETKSLIAKGKILVIKK